MKTILDVSVPVLTFILLGAVGLDLTTWHFERVRHQKLLLAVGVFAPLVLLPPLAAGLVWLFRPAPAVTYGLLLVAVCPIGGISNTYSYLARASPALSVTLTALSCLLAGLTIPILGHALEVAFGSPVHLTAPIPMLVSQFVVMLTLPVALGMWVRQRWGDLASRSQPGVQRLAFIGVGIVLLLIILDNPTAFASGLGTTVPLAIVFVVCSMLVGWAAATVFTRDARDRFTLAAEFGTRNLGVAMAVAVTLLGRVEFARFAYTYFLVEMPLMLAAITLFRRTQRAAIQPVRPVSQP